jgi:hypothetical protein
MSQVGARRLENDPLARGQSFGELAYQAFVGQLSHLALPARAEGGGHDRLILPARALEYLVQDGLGRSRERGGGFRGELCRGVVVPIESESAHAPDFDDRPGGPAILRKGTGPRQPGILLVVDISERSRTINALADYVVGLSEHEADRALSSSGIGVTESGWAQLGHEQKHRAIRALLAGADDESYQRLIQWAVLTGDPLPPALSLPEGTEQPRSDSTASELGQSPPSDPEDPRAAGPIFVVHGHARALLHEAVRVLERATRRDVVVLHEQANQGRTILEKFEDHAGSAAYAVVLLTGDDRGGAAPEAHQPRGRQNVVFELGFFFGRLGRSRVAVLLERDVEKPSDIDGLVYIPIDGAGAWKYELARELSSAGIPVDQSRIP